MLYFLRKYDNTPKNKYLLSNFAENFNFINNVSCDLSNWLLENYQKNRQGKFTKEEEERYVNLLKQIIDLINSEEINE